MFVLGNPQDYVLWCSAVLQRTLAGVIAWDDIKAPLHLPHLACKSIGQPTCPYSHSPVHILKFSLMYLSPSPATGCQQCS